LKKQGITHIVSATIEALPAYKNEFDYLVLTVWDHPNETLIQYFNLTNTYIHHAVANGGKVLIHWYHSLLLFVIHNESINSESYSYYSLSLSLFVSFT
jgi:hypothetical protein